MEDVTFKFILNGISLQTQAKRNDNMKDVFKKYCIKIGKDIKTLLFLYQGKKIDEELKVKDIDSINENIVILVNENFLDNEIWKKIQFSKCIICPICGENCYIEINNYKISLSKCINNHNIKNILLDELKDKMDVNHSKICCDNCKKNKNEVFNQEFYTCLDCKINLCPLCNLSHNKKHNIMKYDMINYTCLIHLEKYLIYCKDCDKNLCGLCGIEHNRNHRIINLKEMVNKDIDKSLNEFRISIENFKSHLNEIIKKINKIIDNFEIFYKMNEEIINNYDFKNNNYQIIKNINTINDYEKKIIKDINKIILENKFNAKLKYIGILYEEMINKNNNNINSEKEDIYKDEQNKDEIQGNLVNQNLKSPNFGHFNFIKNQSNTQPQQSSEDLYFMNKGRQPQQNNVPQNLKEVFRNNDISIYSSLSQNNNEYIGAFYASNNTSTPISEVLINILVKKYIKCEIPSTSGKDLAPNEYLGIKKEIKFINNDPKKDCTIMILINYSKEGKYIKESKIITF